VIARRDLTIDRDLIEEGVTLRLVTRRFRFARCAGWLAIGAVLFSAAAPVAISAKAKFNKVLDHGAPAPSWKNLPGIDDKRHSLADHREAAVVVVVFTGNHCPVSKMYEERLFAFAKKYSARKVQVVAINASRGDGERLEKMKLRANESKWPFPYLRDDTQQIARSYGATVTPHFFVLDEDRKIAYMGAFDDSFDVEQVEKHYLIDAVDALLEGKAPRVKESLQRGCAIEFE
jgi:peroxiredoxin